MNSVSRRTLLATATLSITTRLNAQSGSSAQATISLPAKATGPHIPNDFVGLSYEIQQLVDTSFFSSSNHGLIEQFKAISSNGVLRLGGNTSEFGWWKPTPNTPEPEHPKTRIVEGEPKPEFYAVTAEAVRNLKGFLEATNWTCIYGINMGTNTPERAAEEAAIVSKTLGRRLQYFQIGNEADLYSQHLRDPKTWSAKAYLDEWLTITRAVSARVPDAKFGMPDIAADINWLTQIADLWSAVYNPPHVATLSHHYYFGGPATNPAVNIPNLLSSATMAKVQKTADIAQAAAARMGIRVRMTEGNTCYRGGKPGVSDVFAAALWAADYSLLLASNNYVGVNLHGGTRTAIANGLGGYLPGDVLLKEEGATPERIASHPHPFYGPIASFGSDYVLEPVAYGLKFAGMLSGSTILGNFTAHLKATGVDASAYAAVLPSGETAVVILNKDAAKDISLTIDFGSNKAGKVQITKLQAPALDSREAHIRNGSDSGTVSHGNYDLTVPHASGLLLTLRM